MKLSNIPTAGNNIKLYIHSGGYFIGKVLNVSIVEDNHYAMVRIARKYQNGKISPHNLSKSTMTIPLFVREIWDFADGK